MIISALIQDRQCRSGGRKQIIEIFNSQTIKKEEELTQLIPPLNKVTCLTLRSPQCAVHSRRTSVWDAWMMNAEAKESEQNH